MHLQLKLVYDSPASMKRENFVIEQFMGGRVDLYDDVIKPFAENSHIPYVHCEFDGAMQKARIAKVI